MQPTADNGCYSRGRFFPWGVMPYSVRSIEACGCAPNLQEPLRAPPLGRVPHVCTGIAGALHGLNMVGEALPLFLSGEVHALHRMKSPCHPGTQRSGDLRYIADRTETNHPRLICFSSGLRGRTPITTPCTLVIKKPLLARSIRAGAPVISAMDQRSGNHGGYFDQFPRRLPRQHDKPDAEWRRRLP